MHGEEEGGSVGGGVKMKRFHCLTREEGKMVTARLDRSDWYDVPVRPVALKVREKSHPDSSGEFPEYPGVAQSIRENIQRIRDFDHKEVLE